MRIVKDAFVGDVKFSLAPDYFAISGPDVNTGVECAFQMNREEAKELVEWLHSELNRVLPEIILVPYVSKSAPAALTKAQIGPVYEPGARSATQTVKLVLGDPNLAYQASGGRTGFAGDGDSAVTDLGRLAGKVGKP